MLHVKYAVAFQFNSHLGNFPFLLFTSFKTFQSLRLGVRFRICVWVSVRVSVRVRVGVTVGVRVCFRVSVRATVRVKAKVGLKVYLLCLAYFVSAKPVAAAILAAK